MRKELAQVNHKQIGVGGGRGYLAEPEHPCGLNAHQASEGDAGIEIGTASLLKARRNLGEAADDHAHSGAGREHSVWAVAADESGDGGGKPEDSAADDRVHDQRNQAPAANGADQFVAGRACGRWLHPRLCITNGGSSGNGLASAALRAGLDSRGGRRHMACSAGRVR